MQSPTLPLLERCAIRAALKEAIIENDYPNKQALREALKKQSRVGPAMGIDKEVAVLSGTMMTLAQGCITDFTCQAGQRG